MSDKSCIIKTYTLDDLIIKYHFNKNGCLIKRETFSTTKKINDIIENHKLSETIFDANINGPKRQIQYRCDMNNTIKPYKTTIYENNTITEETHYPNEKVEKIIIKDKTNDNLVSVKHFDEDGNCTIYTEYKNGEEDYAEYFFDGNKGIMYFNNYTNDDMIYKELSSDILPNSDSSSDENIETIIDCNKNEKLTKDNEATKDGFNNLKSSEISYNNKSSAKYHFNTDRKVWKIESYNNDQKTDEVVLQNPFEIDLNNSEDNNVEKETSILIEQDKIKYEIGYTKEGKKHIELFYRDNTDNLEKVKFYYYDGENISKEFIIKQNVDITKDILFENKEDVNDLLSKESRKYILEKVNGRYDKVINQTKNGNEIVYIIEDTPDTYEITKLCNDKPEENIIFNKVYGKYILKSKTIYMEDSYAYRYIYDNNKVVAIFNLKDKTAIQCKLDKDAISPENKKNIYKEDYQKYAKMISEIDNMCKLENDSKISK